MVGVEQSWWVGTEREDLGGVGGEEKAKNKTVFVCVAHYFCVCFYILILYVIYSYYFARVVIIVWLIL